ncbi:helix-turn-helix domain-containing protein [Chryseobacterium zhengzhouense]|uniref:Helix-turn-helix domain-containing protein n=1 Tax=Chryseobacterium zhengzhouense TaxID=1636086 RepID=A0ABW2LW69_9FLAO|nr:helix-turn-helix domain-containing protein [Chryseobacterium sp. S0630]MCP1298728.1 helix-turn-helix domain-containing protein [Chryseobacterium sp. S0630]
MEYLTKDDLSEFKKELFDELQKVFVENRKNLDKNENKWDWLRSKEIRKLLAISPATLQNLRIGEKIRYKKILGSYYYNRNDLELLFKTE